MDGLMYGERQLEDIQRYVLSIDMSVEEYLEMGVTVLIVWTRQLQDPSHREEQETCLSLTALHLSPFWREKNLYFLVGMYSIST